VLFEEAARVFSAGLDALHFLLLDDAAVGSGYLSVAKRARKRYPGIEVMVIGGPKSDDVRLADKRQGIDYYLERPLDEATLAPTVGHRLDIAQLKAEGGIVGRSDAVVDIIETILQVGPTEVPILIEGESGTGKDVIARAIHHTSARREAAYVAINCASLAEGVLESELFGHEKGAFTGAVGQRAGVFERANGGTIFLDEVGEMSAGMQVRLLRVLESGEVLRVGGIKSFHVDVRVVAATNRRLADDVAAGAFRQDLYYRLKGINLHLPPLRNRKDDIPLLVEHFIALARKRHNKDVKGIEPDALRRIVDNPWPGNVRELRNIIDTAVVLSTTGKISLAQLETQLGDVGAPDESLLPVPLHRTRDEAEREMIYASILALHRDVREILSMLHTDAGRRPLDAMREVHAEVPENQAAVPNLADLERAAIVEALRVSDGNRRVASERLGISERTLYRKIKEYGLL
jgi:DNA-binding NtrC family response regulator